MMSSIIFSLFISSLTCFLIIRYGRLHSNLISDPVKGGPQKFHAYPVPRIGGVAIMGGMLAGGITAWLIGQEACSKKYLLILICSIPAFAGGIFEDFTKKVSVKERLLLSMLAAGLGFFLLDARLTRFSLPLVDNWLEFLPFSLLLTLVAVSGIANAVNIIDGFNGLAAMVSSFIAVALAYISYQVGDASLFFVCLSLIGAIIGFFVWNYPNGFIFLGDGGAYLIGFMIAEVSVLLVNRHPEVSPWFPMLLVIYPVWETLFSIYRKKFLRGQSPGKPDGLHFHMMVYKRLLRSEVGHREARRFTRRNAITSPYLWGMSLVGVIPAVLFWRNTLLLICFVMIFILLYVWLYWKIVRFKSPMWLVMKNR